MLRHVYLCVPVLRLRFLGLAAFSRAGLSMFGFWLLGLALCGLDMRGLDLIGRREHLVVCRFFRCCVQLGLGVVGTRLMRNFLTGCFIVIKLLCLLQAFEHM